MILNILLSLLPTVFVIHLFISEFLLYKKGINIDGKPPINKYLFFGSKYTVVLIWVGMVLEIWSIHIPFGFEKSFILRISGIAFWVVGFIFLYVGRFSLGKSFRLGVANEKTEFVAKGIYRISRNPMYIGLYMTFAACMLYSANIIYIVISITVLAIHHLITLAEEQQLKSIYGKAYIDYCKRVRRYM